MKKTKLLITLSLIILAAQFVCAQSVTTQSIDGNTTVMDLTSIESIVFENNNLVFNTTNCEDNYFNVFFIQKMFFDVATPTENIISESTSIFVYPNPATTSLTITKESVNYTDAYIYNIVGNVIMSFTLVNKQSTIDISSLPSGMYFLQINNQSIKFIVQ